MYKKNKLRKTKSNYERQSENFTLRSEVRSYRYTLAGRDSQPVQVYSGTYARPATAVE